MSASAKTLKRSTIFAALVATAMLAIGAASATAAPLAWVIDPGAATVTTIEPAGGQRVGMPIQTGAGPDSIAITPDGRRAYVANSVGKSVTVIETATRIPIATISLPGPAEGVAISFDGTRAYVTTGSDERLAVIDTETNLVERTIDLGSEASAVAAGLSGEVAYVGLASDEVQVVDPATGALVGRPIEVGGVPRAIAISPDGNSVYIAAASEVTVIRSGKAVHIPIGAVASGLAVSPDGERLYVSSATGGTVTTIDTATDEIVGTPIPVPGEPIEIALTASGKTAYVANRSTERLTPINLAKGTAEPPLSPAGSGGNLVIAPDQPPIAAFEAPRGTTGVPVTLSGAPSTDPDGSIALYQWSLDELGPSTGLTVTHTYLDPGNYLALLTVTDDEGCSVTKVFTGRTVYCDGGSSAVAGHTVSVTSPPIIPSNKFHVGRLVHNRKNGTARLLVRLPAAGSVVLFGKQVHEVKKKNGAAGTMWLTIHARVELNKRLKKIHRRTVRVRITFTPTGGTERTVHRAITLLHAAKKK
jgi:YVTN family beta-propeller protein